MYFLGFILASILQLFCTQKIQTPKFYGDNINVVVREAILESHTPADGGWSDIICRAELYTNGLLIDKTGQEYLNITIIGCGPDFNCDGSVDLLDFQRMQILWSGS